MPSADRCGIIQSDGPSSAVLNYMSANGADMLKADGKGGIKYNMQDANVVKYINEAVDFYAKSGISRASEQVFIPLTVGGGISSVEDFSSLLSCGADKIAVNSAAVDNPSLLSEAALKFGSQCVVLAVDAKSNGCGGWNVYKHGGRIDTGIDVLEWVVRAEKLGAGEILLTSMDRDGTKEGFDVPLTKAVSSLVNIPVIASGGAGKEQDFAEILEEGGADAALAASLFHFGQLGIKELKNYLSERGIPVRGGYHG